MAAGYKFALVNPVVVTLTQSFRGVLGCGEIGAWTERTSSGSTVTSPNIARPLTLRISQSHYAIFNQSKFYT